MGIPELSKQYFFCDSYRGIEKELQTYKITGCLSRHSLNIFLKDPHCVSCFYEDCLLLKVIEDQPRKTTRPERRASGSSFLITYL
jgi:hypothetical protein